jgi:hypothetical protein
LSSQRTQTANQGWCSIDRNLTSLTNKSLTEAANQSGFFLENEVLCHRKNSRISHYRPSVNKNTLLDELDIKCMFNMFAIDAVTQREDRRIRITSFNGYFFFNKRSKQFATSKHVM